MTSAAPGSDSKNGASLGSRIKLALKQDYGSDRTPSSGLPVLLEVMGYSAIGFLAFGLVAGMVAEVGSPGLWVASLLLDLLLLLFFMSVFLHAVLWTVGTGWKFCTTRLLAR